MATEAQPVGGFQQAELSSELASQWRHLTTRYRENPYEIEARRAVAETLGDSRS